MRSSLKRRIKGFLSGYLEILGVFDGIYAYKGPRYAQIDLTNNCNNDCVGCWCNSPLLEEKKISPAVKSQTIPFARVKELIDEFYSMGTHHIYYAGGGEPFMHPEIMRILAYTKKRGLECYVNTNFTLVDKNMAKELSDIGVDSLTVSVWAGSPGVYAATHPNKDEAAFLKIKETLRYLNSLKRRRPFIKVYNVVFNLNYQDIENMLDFVLETKSEAVEFTVIDTIPGKTDKLIFNDAERRILLEKCRKIKDVCENNVKGKPEILGFEQFMRRVANDKGRAAEYDSDIIGAIPCYVGWAFTRILADGNVNSCLKSHRFPVGNILNQSFAEAWNGPRQRYFRKKVFPMQKTDPFFSLIGNDPSCSMGCYKSCDNLGHNMYLHGRINRLGKSQKDILRLVAGAMKLLRLD